MDDVPVDFDFGTLDTHPEYDNIDLDDASFMNHARNPALTFVPELFKVRADGHSDPDTWVVGVPCFRLALDPADVEADDDPPGDYGTYYDHLFVQFWNVQDPIGDLSGSGPNGRGHPADLPDIIWHDSATHGQGKYGDLGAAADIEVIEWDDRVLCFIADFGGRVHAYDVSDLLQSSNNEPVLLSTWVEPGCLTDDFPNTVSSLALDQAQWTVGETSYDELFVYASIQRVGIEVLWWCRQHDRLAPIALIQTPGDAHEVRLRIDDRGESVVKTLLVADAWGVPDSRIQRLGWARP